MIQERVDERFLKLPDHPSNERASWQYWESSCSGEKKSLLPLLQWKKEKKIFYQQLKTLKMMTGYTACGERSWVRASHSKLNENSHQGK